MKVTGLPFTQAKWSYGATTKYGIAVHATSNTASAKDEASYATRRSDGTSTHFFVDKTSVIQVLDTSLKAGHAGSSNGNNYAIAFEFCGVDGWSRAQWISNINFKKAGEVIATVIKSHWPDGTFQVRRASVGEMKSNPKVKALYAHDDMRQAWGGTDHTDPGKNFPWDVLLDAIKAAQGQPAQPAGTRTLKLTSPYMTGEDVKICQRYVDAEEDGIFGPDTQSKVQAWQGPKLLPVDGQWKPVDQATASNPGRQVLIKSANEDAIFLTFFNGGRRYRFHVIAPQDVIRWQNVHIQQVVVDDTSKYGLELK